MAAGTLDELLSRVPVDEITARARKARPGHALLTVIGALLFGIGWCVAKAFAVAWLALAWMYAAVAVGWHQARGTTPPGPDLASLMAQNKRLRDENTRLDLAGLAPELGRLQDEITRLRAENARLS